MIRQLAEIVEKTRRLGDLAKSCPVGIHHHPPPATQWITTDSALQPFVTQLFTRLPLAPKAPREVLRKEAHRLNPVVSLLGKGRRHHLSRSSKIFFCKLSQVQEVSTRIIPILHERF